MPDTFPLTSIIIPNYNGLRFLTPCLDALRAQSYPREHTEIILVDDASTDSSVAFVAEHYPEVKIVQLARNSGLAVGCNAGARAAAGELLVMLNNDTEVGAGLAGRVGRGRGGEPPGRRDRQQDAALRPPRHAAQRGRYDGRRRHPAQPRGVGGGSRASSTPSRRSSAAAAAG